MAAKGVHETSTSTVYDPENKEQVWPKEREYSAAETRERRLSGNKRYLELKEEKRKDLEANRYSQFREQFDDIFEVTMKKRMEQKDTVESEIKKES